MKKYLNFINKVAFSFLRIDVIPSTKLRGKRLLLRLLSVSFGKSHNIWIFWVESSIKFVHLYNKLLMLWWHTISFYGFFWLDTICSWFYNIITFNLRWIISPCFSVMGSGLKIFFRWTKTVFTVFMFHFIIK